MNKEKSHAKEETKMKNKKSKSPVRPLCVSEKAPLAYNNPTFFFLLFSLFFCFTACENPIMIKLLEPFTSQGGNKKPAEVHVSGDNIQDKLRQIGENPKSDTVYKVTIDGNESLGPSVLSYPNTSNITIQISGTGQTLALSSAGSLFTIGNGVTLELDGVILQGIDGNNAALVTVSGGELVLKDGAGIINNKNTAESGGGVFVERGKFTMEGGNISGNTVPQGGGEGKLNGYGGGVLNRDEFIMKGGEISGGNTAQSGGGVDNFHIFTMEGGTIKDNFAGAGGGVDNHERCTFTMTGGEISGNTAQSGGGVANGGTFNMSGNAVISGNTAQYGGGVENQEGQTFNMNGGTISGNTADLGGGVYVVANGTFNMEGGTISGNNAAAGGGVASGGAFYMSGGDIIDNGKKTGGDDGDGGQMEQMGGGVYVPGNGTFTMSGGTISGNTADLGGGVYVDIGDAYYEGDDVVVPVYGGEFTMSGGVISVNYARYGGGVYVSNSTEFSKANGKFTGGGITGVFGNICKGEDVYYTSGRND